MYNVFLAQSNKRNWNWNWGTQAGSLIWMKCIVQEANQVELIWRPATSRPHRLMKNGSKHSKRRDLQLKWLYRETNDIHFIINNILFGISGKCNYSSISFSLSLLQNFCHGNPCGGKNFVCQVGFTNKGYRCVCHEGYTGGYCDKGN